MASPEPTERARPAHGINRRRYPINPTHDRYRWWLLAVASVGADGMRGGYGVLQVPGVIAAINAGLAAAATTIAAAEVTTETIAITLGILIFSVVLGASLRSIPAALADGRGRDLAGLGPDGGAR